MGPRTRPGVPFAERRSGWGIPGIGGQAQPPAPAAGQCQRVCRVVRYAAGTAALCHGRCVDAALNLSVYDSPRGAQLSGRILDLHPAGLGTTLAEQAAFVVALRCGTPLTEEQKKLITPERSDIVTVYRELQARRWHAEDLQPLCAKLGEENTGKTLVAVTALEQVGLIAAVEKGGAKYLELVPAQGKKNLADAPVLKCLEGM